nr:phosphatidylinositol 4-kinase gamma 4-like [Tanacetum cinerariifolium]
FEDCTFDWLYWPQARKPFSPETVDYIESLDVEDDIALLNFYGWSLPSECALQEAEDLILPGMSEAAFIDAVSEIMDQRLDSMS